MVEFRSERKAIVSPMFLFVDMHIVTKTRFIVEDSPQPLNFIIFLGICAVFCRSAIGE